MVFLTRPISAALLVVAVSALVLAVLPAVRRRREVVFQRSCDDVEFDELTAWATGRLVAQGPGIRVPGMTAL
jgi:hypothetical protein